MTAWMTSAKALLHTSLWKIKLGHISAQTATLGKRLGPWIVTYFIKTPLLVLAGRRGAGTLTIRAADYPDGLTVRRTTTETLGG